MTTNPQMNVYLDPEDRALINQARAAQRRIHDRDCVAPRQLNLSAVARQAVRQHCHEIIQLDAYQREATW